MKRIERFLHLSNRDVRLRPSDKGWHNPLFLTITEWRTKNWRQRSPAKAAEKRANFAAKAAARRSSGSAAKRSKSEHWPREREPERAASSWEDTRWSSANWEQGEWQEPHESRTDWREQRHEWHETHHDWQEPRGSRNEWEESRTSRDRWHEPYGSSSTSWDDSNTQWREDDRDQWHNRDEQTWSWRESRSRDRSQGRRSPSRSRGSSHSWWQSPVAWATWGASAWQGRAPAITVRTPSDVAFVTDGADYSILLAAISIVILLMVCCFMAGCWAHRQCSKRPDTADAMTQSERTRTRAICVQSQTMYTYWRTQPRFQPLPEVFPWRLPELCCSLKLKQRGHRSRAQQRRAELREHSLAEPSPRNCIQEEVSTVLLHHTARAVPRCRLQAWLMKVEHGSTLAHTACAVTATM